MAQITLFSPPTWTVGDLTRYLRDLFDSDELLNDLWVSGEISNLSRPASGHMYFTIKDRDSQLRCVMWKNSVTRLEFNPREGQAIEVHGSVSIYEAGGQYQLYADQLRSAGEGALFQEFLRLKARLEAEGLFSPERKRPIPHIPQRIGIVTSPTAAALQDVIRTLKRRFPLAEVILAPSPVQGEDAPPGLVAALNDLNRYCNPDVILLARGGGSIEDLWAFNDERVAYAIAASIAPVICGVGHETDFTIADFVADLRAPTPSIAAELAAPNQDDLRQMLDEMSVRLGNLIQQSIDSLRWQFERLKLRSPGERICSERQRLDNKISQACATISHCISMSKTNLEGFQKQLTSLNPLSVLQRGFAIVSKEDGQIICSVRQVERHDRLNVRVSDGEFLTEVSSS